MNWGKGEIFPQNGEHARVAAMTFGGIHKMKKEMIEEKRKTDPKFSVDF